MAKKLTKTLTVQAALATCDFGIRDFDDSQTQKPRIVGKKLLFLA